MTIRIGINGFGRIGRTVFRIAEQNSDIEIVHINDLLDTKTLSHLLKYDSIMGRFDGTVENADNGIKVNGKHISISAEKDPSNIPWGPKKIDIVLESTGAFRNRTGVEKHIKGGAKKVLLSVPSKTPSDVDATVVFGVNCNTLKSSDKLVSNASCTTNCLAPVVKVLNEKFGIEHGLMTTVHSYTNDQNILDAPHKDLRRARSAATNIIPTSTGAAKAVGLVIPDLNGKLNGCAMRVPTQTGSLVDLVVTLKKSTTKEKINAAMKEAAAGELKGVLDYTEDPIVLTDIIGDPHTSIFDAQATMMIGDNMVKTISWYDNEYGYSAKCIELFRMMAK